MAARQTPGILVQCLLLLAISAAAAGAARLFYAQPLPLNYPWSQHVERTAQDRGMRIAAVDEVKLMAESFSHVILDARKESDYFAGHIPHALSLPVGDLEQHYGGIASMLTPDQPILVYCSGHDCDESLQLGEILIQSGFTNIVLFIGGMKEWEEAGQPVAR